MIERAVPLDHQELTLLTNRSKAYWKYSRQQMDEWDTLLTITPEYITDNETYKLVSSNTIIGYYSFYIKGETVYLDNLFIDPDHIGEGFGKILMDHFLAGVPSYKCSSVVVESDPNAEGFYKRFGFLKIGNKTASLKDRFVPVMELTLSK